MRQIEGYGFTGLTRNAFCGTYTLYVSTLWQRVL